MKDKHISLGKVIGIPINLDYSWFLVLLLLTWMLAQSYFPQEFKHWSQFSYWSIGLVTSILFFLSILLHELGHSIVARKYKIKVKRITLFIFGGVAEITSEPPKSTAEFWIAIAGPIASFLLAGIFYLLEHLFAGNNYLVAPFRYLAFINFILAVFNLIPGFPLDGGRVLRSIVWAITKNLKKATTIAANVGRFFGYFFILLGVLQIFQNNFIDGIWIAFIGWFLESAAISQIQRQALDELLFGHKVSEAMSVDFGIVHSDSSIQEIIDNHFIGANRRSLLVKDDNKIIGYVTPSKIASISSNDRQNKTVNEIMIPINAVAKVKSDEPLLDALKEIEQSEVNEVPVVEGDNFVGVLNQNSIFKFIIDLHKLGH
jgi:Zn-dependent protease/CBS domain-containing protein